MHWGMLFRKRSLGEVLEVMPLTPHTGNATQQARQEMMEHLVQSVPASLNGLSIPNEMLLK